MYQTAIISNKNQFERKSIFIIFLVNGYSLLINQEETFKKRKKEKGKGSIVY